MSPAYASLQMPTETPLEALQRAELSGGVLPEEEGYPELYYWLWLAELLTAGNARAGNVLDEFGDAETAYAFRETARFATAVGKAAANRAQGMQINPKACALHIARHEAAGISILTFADAEYPLSLSRIPDPPLVLYATGDLSALRKGKMIGMVGTRRPTAYGAASAQRFGNDFAAAGAVIVSGLADGLDGESHRAAVQQGCVTIGVLGVSISTTYPASNAHLRREMEACGGLVLSEYPDGFHASSGRTFLQRNRIIAALSDVLVVIEAREKSGTMSTVAHAERYDTPIYAVPGSVFSDLSQGTNMLLREGRAKMLIESVDVLSALGLHSKKTQENKANTASKAPLTANAKKALACIGPVAVGVATISQQSGLSMGALLGALTALELSGYIIALPGRQYRLK